MKTVEAKPEERQIPVFHLAVILVTAYFLIDLGIAELVYLVGRFVFDIEPDRPLSLLNFIFPWIGIGILRRRAQQRGCALWLLGFLAIALPFGILALFYEKWTAPAPVFSWWTVIYCAAGFGCASISWWVLKKHDGYFGSELPDAIHRQQTALIWSFVLVSLIMNSVTLAVYHDMEKTVDSAFAVDTEIHVYDLETREHLPHAGFEVNLEPPAHVQNSVRTTSGSSRTEDGDRRTWMKFSGIAFGKYVVGVGHEGYETKEITITRETDDEISVYLDPLPEDATKN